MTFQHVSRLRVVTVDARLPLGFAPGSQSEPSVLHKGAVFGLSRTLWMTEANNAATSSHLSYTFLTTIIPSILLFV